MVEAKLSSENYVLIKATRRNIQENGNLHCHRRENLKILQSINWLDSVAET
jgi:hypothetical protein